MGFANQWCESMGSDVRSNSNLASGLKSRPRNCPYTLVARRSGVRAIEGREFLNDKDAGRNASEPSSSLVNLMRLPTSCLNREGRSTDVQARGATLVSRRGRGWGERRRPRIRRRNRGGSLWKSEGFTVPGAGLGPAVAQGQHKPERGKEPCFVHATSIGENSLT